jgi:hypothetical protein
MLATKSPTGDFVTSSLRPMNQPSRWLLDTMTSISATSDSERSWLYTAAVLCNSGKKKHELSSGSTSKSPELVDHQIITAAMLWKSASTFNWRTFKPGKHDLQYTISVSYITVNNIRKIGCIAVKRYCAWICSYAGRLSTFRPPAYTIKSLPARTFIIFALDTSST